jgi:hypothetical protein
MISPGFPKYEFYRLSYRRGKNNFYVPEPGAAFAPAATLWYNITKKNDFPRKAFSPDA